MKAIKAVNNLELLSKLWTACNCYQSLRRLVTQKIVASFNTFLDFGCLFWTTSIILTILDISWKLPPTHFLQKLVDHYWVEAEDEKQWKKVSKNKKANLKFQEIIFIFFAARLDTKESPKNLPSAGQTLNVMEMTLILNHTNRHQGSEKTIPDTQLGHWRLESFGCQGRRTYKTAELRSANMWRSYKRLWV